MGLDCLPLPPALSKVSISPNPYTGPAFPQEPPASKPAHHHSLCTRASDLEASSTLGQHLLGPSPFLCQPGPLPQDPRLLRTQLIHLYPSFLVPTACSALHYRAECGWRNVTQPRALRPHKLVATPLGWAPKLSPVPERPLSLLVQDFALSFLSGLPSIPIALNSYFRAKEGLSEGPPFNFLAI